MDCKGNTCDGAYGMLHSLGHVIKDPRNLVFGLISFLFSSISYYLFFSYKSKKLGIMMWENGWVMELHKALHAETYMDLTLTMLFSGIIYVIAMIFFYASLVFYSNRWHAGQTTSVSEAIKFGLMKLTSITMLSLTITFFVIKMLSMHLFIYTSNNIVLYIGSGLLMLLGLIVSFSLIVHVIDEYGYIDSLKISSKTVLSHLWEIVVGSFVWVVIFVPVLYLIYSYKDSYCLMGCMNKENIFVFLSLIWLIVGFTTWVIFLSRTYRHANKSRGIISSFFGMFK